MKVTKIIISILLAAAALFVGYLSIDSVLTPIQFEETKAEREAKIQERLLDLRTAVNEYKIVNGCYTDNLDSLVYFLNFFLILFLNTLKQFNRKCKIF